jgi:exopolyphosphatase/guanosine-5'-triphosphate,3'-diphosphate pyrophosphatase
MNIAVIDIGTNTFNLLIAEKTNHAAFRILHSSKIFVKLAKGGIDKKELKSDAITRGIKAMEKLLLIAERYHAESVFAYATAAVRNAKNGNQFTKAIKDKFGIEVSIIDPEREAELVYHGVKKAVEIDSSVLIMDIGGGSIEFIIADNSRIYWKKSYPTGVAYLLEKFKPSDPLLIEEIEMLTNFFEERLAQVFEEIKKHHVVTLIGASGAFESFAAMIRGDENFESETGLSPEAYEIDLHEFDDLSWRLISSTVKERKKIKGLEPMRIEYIVLAALLVKFLIEKAAIKTFIQSGFALKEGLMQELTVK